MALKKTGIGESTLKGTPNKRICFVLGDKVVTTDKIADGAVTAEKMNNNIVEGLVARVVPLIVEQSSMIVKNVAPSNNIILQPNTITEVTFSGNSNYNPFVSFTSPVGGKQNIYCLNIDLIDNGGEMIEVPMLSFPDTIQWKTSVPLLSANTHTSIVIKYECGRFYGDFGVYQRSLDLAGIEIMTHFLDGGNYEGMLEIFLAIDVGGHIWSYVEQPIEIILAKVDESLLKVKERKTVSFVFGEELHKELDIYTEQGYKWYVETVSPQQISPNVMWQYEKMPEILEIPEPGEWGRPIE